MIGLSWSLTNLLISFLSICILIATLIVTEAVPGLRKWKHLVRTPWTARASSNDDRWGVMGPITPLHDFDFRTVEPRRIYKFPPKYFLTMGLQKSNINQIVFIDKTYLDRLKARQELVRQDPGSLDLHESAGDMVDELYELLVQEILPKQYPTIFRRHDRDQTVENLLTHDRFPLHAPRDRHAALATLNRNLDEDFLMLLPAPDGDGYSLQAFVFAYPVGFTPQSKLGIKLRDAHRPVPAYREKLQSSMDRYFERVRPGSIMCRYNWAIATSPKLRETGQYHVAPGEQPVAEANLDPAECFVRCESQTVFALPRSGGRILAVHLYLYPLREIKELGLGPEVVRAIDGLDQGNAPGVSHYKRAALWAEPVKEYLLN